MAFALQIPVPYLPTYPKTTQPNTHLRIKSTLNCSQLLKSTGITTRRRKVQFFIKAFEEGAKNNTQESESETTITQQSPPNEPQSTKTTTTASVSSDGLSELGSEIKKAMKERDQREDKDGDFWGGVGEEIKEIEWPAFGKVLGTTGVVIGVIAGSSVVLLTLNAILAELSDQVFAGKGVQDFFS